MFDVRPSWRKKTRCPTPHNRAVRNSSPCAVQDTSDVVELCLAVFCGAGRGRRSRTIQESHEQCLALGVAGKLIRLDRVRVSTAVLRDWIQRATRSLVQFGGEELVGDALLNLLLQGRHDL